ncbi:collagen alpha-1(XXVI) chain-like [Ursus americanus]|uniref:collagen alpha-1(XXVI) chain-like n=1 Tax=Ursus americanus TaxID=9643 RepID=UPI001E67DEA1|nr:collagen alpha-1(XXVI) chain-like [Ursus americanus]
MPPPSAQDRRPPRRPRQPAARRLAPSRGRPPARGGAGALAEGRRRRRLRGLTKPTRRRSATYSTARVVMETHQLKPAAIGSVRASSEEGGGARRRRPTRGRREDGGRGPFNVSGSEHHPARPRPRAPPGPAAGLPLRPRALPGPAAGPRTRTKPQIPGPPAPAALLDLNPGAGAGAAELGNLQLIDAEFQHPRWAELFFHLALNASVLGQRKAIAGTSGPRGPSRVDSGPSCQAPPVPRKRPVTILGSPQEQNADADRGKVTLASSPGSSHGLMGARLLLHCLSPERTCLNLGPWP